MFLANRFLRILPLYGCCLLFWWQVAPRTGSGPFWFAWEGPVDKCNRLWWTNLLFVNNLVPLNGSETDGCFYWAWYLALDMQFTWMLATPTLLVLSHMQGSTLLARRLVLLLFAASVGGGFVFTLLTGVSANSFDGAWVTQYSRHFYTKPWFRAPPYLLGVYVAILWGASVSSERNGSASSSSSSSSSSSVPPSSSSSADFASDLVWPLTPVLALLRCSSVTERAEGVVRRWLPGGVHWGGSRGASGGGRQPPHSSSFLDPPLLVLSLSIALLGVATFAPASAYQRLPCPYGADVIATLHGPLACGSGWSVWKRACFNALGPAAWSVGVSLIAVLSFRGEAGIVGRFLGHPGWVPLARLSYGAYLIHPIILNFLVLGKANKMRLDTLAFVAFFTAASCLTFATTAAAVILLEYPLAHLTKTAFASAEKRSSNRRVGGSGGSGDSQHPPPPSSSKSFLSSKAVPSTVNLELVCSSPSSSAVLAHSQTSGGELGALSGVAR